METCSSRFPEILHLMKALLTILAVLAACPALYAAEGGKGAEAPAAPGQTPTPAAPGPVPAAPAPAEPRFKTPAAAERFREGRRRMESEDYTGARTIFSSCLKDAEGPEDRKRINGLIDDTRLGVEIAAARKMVDRKDEKRAIARVEKALKAHPSSSLRSTAERFIRETEELIYIILDDFEPGSSLQLETAPAEDAEAGAGKDDPSAGKKETAEGDPKAGGGKESKAAPPSQRPKRWPSNFSYNSDPRFVAHGKGSCKWRLPGNQVGRSSTVGGGYRSATLARPITGWRTLSFSIYLPEVDDGALQVTLAPQADSDVTASRYTEKFIELKGKGGWMEVRLDLQRDFGNSRFVPLENVRVVRISSAHHLQRTIYLDFIRFEDPVSRSGR